MSDAGSHSSIPAIVTTDLSSTHALNDDERHTPSFRHDDDSAHDPSPLDSNFPPTPSSHVAYNPHAVPIRPSADPSLLSPFSKPSVGHHSARMSLDVPRSHSPSPTFASSNEGTTLNVPPSPTLSTRSSVQFTTSLSLRDNKPEDRNGLSSLGLLNPLFDTTPTHRRKSSNATWASSAEGHSSLDETEPDHGTADIALAQLHRAKSDATSMTVASHTHTHFDSGSERSKSRPRSKSVGGFSDDLPHPSSHPVHPLNDDQTNSRPGNEPTDDDESGGVLDIDLDQDADIDPGPFSFKPYELASLLDPKNLEALEALGGITGILKGLGTNRTHGLSKQATAKILVSNDGGGGSLSDGRPGAGVGASQRHDRHSTEAKELPGIIVTGPEDELPDPHHHDDIAEHGPAFQASFDERRRVFGENILPQRASKSLLALMWLALKDKVLVILSFAAIVSLALGLFQDFGTTLPPGQPPVDWVEGVAIMVAILIVVIVGSVNDWQKERQFKSLNEKKEERGVKVIRDGVEHVIDVKEVVVGDVALLEPGEIVPCDGIFLSGHNVKCDESGATGESDAIKKMSYGDCLALRNTQRNALREQGGADGGDQGGHVFKGSSHTDCFVVSGSKVLEGVGSYVVVAVGTKSFNGRIMMALRTDTENTPLQLKLNALAELIAKIGSAAGIILFSALMIRFFVQLGTNSPERNANQKGMAFVNILIISVTLIVVAVPEGLPLAVTLALAFATKRMTKENLLVRVLGSCETMANASVICTDKTGTLTQNAMTVVAGSIGIHAKFVRKLGENQSRTNANEERGGRRRVEDGSSRKHTDDFSIDQSELHTVLSPQLRELTNAAISVNSTAFEDEDPETGERAFVGSKTETALLNFAKELGWPDYKKTRDAADIVQMIPFTSDRKAMGVVVRLGQGRYRLHLKGASEILTKMCSRHVVVKKDEEQGRTEGREEEIETAPIDELASENISRTTIFYANQTLRTIALCYRDFDCWPPAEAQLEDDEVAYEDIAQNLILIGITGIEDPLRDGVREAVASCRKAGVVVTMCTGDNVLTARSIASQCGIYTAGGIVMEGPVFRQLTEHEMMEVVPRLQVLARSSPEDKKILVEKLRSLGEIVGVTGDGTNDGPALKTAHVGFSMGVTGTEVAKEASDIILMDDNFSSIVKAIMWGRCVNDAVRKFLQFQISTNVTAVVITFVTAVASNSEESVLSAVQLLWINIIMDTFAALALATDPASPALLDRKPDKQTAPLFTVNMYKQIMLQSTYQIAITLVFHFLGLRILGYESESGSTEYDSIVQTVVFNTFVFAQIFNSVNSRRLDRKLNIFEGISRNYYFVGITLLEIAVQVLIVFIGGAAFQVTRIGGREWGISLALGFVSIPLGALIRILPNGPFERLFVKMRLFPNSKVLPTSRADVEWNAAIELVRDNLATFAHVRGGRLRSSSFVVKSRNARIHDHARVPLPSLMTMVPTLIASSIGAGWAPQMNGSLSDPARYDPSKSSAALWEGKFQIHPDTKPDDPLYKKWSRANNNSPPV